MTDPTEASAMNVLDAIYRRRAVKHFDPSQTLNAEQETTLLAATLQAPTSFNIQHWRFVILRDPALRAQLRAELGNDQAQITDAALLVLFTADVMAWQKNPERYCTGAPPPIARQLTELIGAFYRGRDWLQRDEAQRSIGIAMQTLMLAAQALDLQSCPMIGFDIDKVAALVNLPADHVLGPMVAIGRATQPPWPKTGQLTLPALVVENRF